MPHVFEEAFSTRGTDQVGTMGDFTIVKTEDIRKGDCTDVYFDRAREILTAEGINPFVVAEVSAADLPDAWGIFSGLSDVMALLEGLPVTVHALPEGSLFHANEPVLQIHGRYLDFCRFETGVLGFICHASGIASAAAWIKAAAGDRKVFSFGSRRQHPAIAAMVERSAWIGGVDGASNTAAPEGIPVVGTMPHSYVLCHEKSEDAFLQFHQHADPDVQRVMLIDTFCDEKREALIAASCGATAVRLDTPRSRRGRMRSILEEVRWELDAAGYGDVNLFLSGGVTREDICQYKDLVAGFGVGGAIANAPVIDFSLDIVEKEGKPCAKRGKRSMKKQIYECPDGRRIVMPESARPPAGARPLLETVIRGGQVLTGCDLHEARKRALAHIAKYS